jgi:uncharacterized protein YraI
MKHSFPPALSLVFCFLLLGSLLSACGPTPEEQATLTATAKTATAFAWTRTFTSTRTFTPTLTFTSTATLTPTITDTPTITFTPTYNFPKVRVNVANLACRYGPSTAYLYALDLHEGDTGVVWGRHANSIWLYVKMDNLPIPCWVHPYYLDIEGDITKMMYQEVRLPMTDALYHSPEKVWAERDTSTNTVTVYWSEVWMTEDDDRGYFLDVWVCQGGNFVWVPVGIPNQYTTQHSFQDEPGCSQPSGGKLYTVEKHGYTTPVDIPWPP